MDSFEYCPNYSMPGKSRLEWELLLWYENNESGKSSYSWCETILAEMKWQAKRLNPERKRPSKDGAEAISR